tara:strand:- start:953 stop:1162 length:210 start_codon:yes stop_codon:yes gene_type:complete
MTNKQKEMRKGKLQRVCIKVPEGMLKEVDSFRSNLLTTQSIEMSRSAAFRHLIASNPIWSAGGDQELGE